MNSLPVHASRRMTSLVARARQSGPRTLRNARTLGASAVQHLIDDPALFAVQISRRMPLAARVGAGRALTLLGALVPRGAGISSLGAFMAGDIDRASEIVEEPGSSTALKGEVAILLGRPDLVTEESSPSTRARAAWAMGDLSGAVAILDSAGRGASPQARRLRSELQLLTAGHRLEAPRNAVHRTHAPRGERLRVLHLITNSLPHTQSGYALRTHNILRGLRGHGIDSLALTRTGYPVMIGKPWCADEDVVDGIHYRRALPAKLASTPEGRLRQEVDEALELVDEFRPHVLHATTDYRNALVAQAVSEATGIPWLFEVRGLMEQTWIASHRIEELRQVAADSEKVRRIVEQESGLAREAGAVVTLSRTMAETLNDRGVPAERMSLVPNGVDASLLEERLDPAEARARLELQLPGDALAVGSASALVDYEGHDVLLRAIAHILADHSVPDQLKERLYVVIVGDGVTAPHLAELAAGLGLSDRLVMPGRVPRSQARTWVQALDLVAVPRKDFEVTRTVTPQKPAEAMALGRPVVASDLPALRETLIGAGGETLGVLVPPESPRELATAIHDLLDDDARRADLGTRGRAAAMDRTWPAMMKRYEVAYRALVEKTAEGTRRGE